MYLINLTYLVICINVNHVDKCITRFYYLFMVLCTFTQKIKIFGRNVGVISPSQKFLLLILP
jgi:hypothetical protein